MLLIWLKINGQRALQVVMSPKSFYCPIKGPFAKLFRCEKGDLIHYKRHKERRTQAKTTLFLYSNRSRAIEEREVEVRMPLFSSTRSSDSLLVQEILLNWLQACYDLDWHQAMPRVALLKCIVLSHSWLEDMFTVPTPVSRSRPDSFALFQQGLLRFRFRACSSRFVVLFHGSEQPPSGLLPASLPRTGLTL